MLVLLCRKRLIGYKPKPPLSLSSLPPRCSCSILHVGFGWFAGWFLLIHFPPPTPLPFSHPYCSLSKPYSWALSWLCSTGVSASCGRKVHTDMTSVYLSAVLSVCLSLMRLSVCHHWKVSEANRSFWSVMNSGSWVSAGKLTCWNGKEISLWAQHRFPPWELIIFENKNYRHCCWKWKLL